MKGISKIHDISISEQQTIEEIDRISKDLGRALSAPHPTLKLAVVIPAKDEGNGIRFTLESLARQLNRDGSPFDPSIFEVLVLAHNCSDNTKLQCEGFFRENSRIQGHVIELISEVAKTVGSARRILMNIAYHRISVKKGLIITTDADTVADPYWLYYLDEYIEKNVDLVGGLIISDPSQLDYQASSYLIAKDEYLFLKSRLESQLLPNPNNPWPRHGFNWGPNLAIKKSAYGAIGGIRPMHFLEDVDLYNRVVSAGLIARHCLKCKVITSTRIDSRCNEGFGAELRVWTDMEGVDYNVEGLEKLLIRYKIYSLLQEFYIIKSPHIFSEIIYRSLIGTEELEQMVQDSERVEALIIKMENYLNQSASWNAIYPNRGVFQVRDELKRYFDQPSSLGAAIASPTVQVHNGLP